VPVKVRVLLGNRLIPIGFRRPVGELLFMIPATGGSVSGTIAWPIPANATFDPDFSNLITVVVDPNNEVAERNEGNNVALVWGTCVG
jgi:hypothetical protein